MCSCSRIGVMKINSGASSVFDFESRVQIHYWLDPLGNIIKVGEHCFASFFCRFAH